MPGGLQGARRGGRRRRLAGGDRLQRVAALAGGEVVRSEGRVGGGAAPGVPLPGWGVAYDEDLAAALAQ